jgi:hypothetical protein
MKLQNYIKVLTYTPTHTNWLCNFFGAMKTMGISCPCSAKAPAFVALKQASTLAACLETYFELDVAIDAERKNTSHMLCIVKYCIYFAVYQRFLLRFFSSQKNTIFMVLHRINTSL